MKNLFYTLFAGLVLFSCQQQEPDISTEKSEVQLSLRDVFFGEAGSAGGRVNAITWAHVLGGNGSITFDNVDNDYSASYALDGSNLGAGTYSIPNGNYDITVDLNSVTPADYLPYTASLLGQSISSSQTLTFDAVTTFGLVLLGLDSVDQAVTPTFNLSSTDYDLTLDAVQEFYYLYVPGATTGTLTATETFYDQSLSLEVNVSTSTTHAYAFKITSSDAGIGVNFTDFTVVESDWDIDGYQQTSGNALDFDGVNDVVTIANGFDLSASDQMTIETWVYFDTDFTPIRTIAWQGTNGLPDWIIRVGNNSVNHLNFGVQTTTGWTENQVVVSPANFTNAWNHIAMVYNGANLLLYLNGSLIASPAKTGNMNFTPGATVSLGNAVPGGQIFDGKIDEVRAWSVARSAQEITDYYNVALLGSETGLFAYYNFNQGEAGGNNAGISSIPDQSGNGNDGTLNSFSLSGNTSNFVTSDAY